MHYKIYHVMIYMIHEVIGSLYIESICTYMHYIIVMYIYEHGLYIGYISGKAYMET